MCLSLTCLSSWGGSILRAIFSPEALSVCVSTCAPNHSCHHPALQPVVLWIFLGPEAPLPVHSRLWQLSKSRFVPSHIDRWGKQIAAAVSSRQQHFPGLNAFRPGPLRKSHITGFFLLPSLRVPLFILPRGSVTTLPLSTVVSCGYPPTQSLRWSVFFSNSSCYVEGVTFRVKPTLCLQCTGSTGFS